MRKVLFGLIILFVGSQLMVSCTSNNTVLSQFSKRKYLKKFKKTNVKYDSKLANYELAANTNNNLKLASFKMNEIEANDDANLVLDANLGLTQTKKHNVLPKINVNWRKYNRKLNLVDFTKSLSNNKFLKHQSKTQASRVDDVVLIILGIFIPPLAVFLYEGSITNNFWVDLILSLLFWFPGMIFAFLVMFGGVSI